MQPITYLQSCNVFFAPLDEIIEALENGEGIQGLTNAELTYTVKSNEVLDFYIKNFDTHVN